MRGTGSHNFFRLDTNTGTLTDLGFDGPRLGASNFGLRVALSDDNVRVYFNSDGYGFTMDTATNNTVSASVNPGYCYGNYDLALAPNKTQLQASGYLYDSNLNAMSAPTLNDRKVQDTSYVYGAKFSPDGSLLFQPSAQGIDVIDIRLGTLLSRIAFPVPVSANYDAIISDRKDNIPIAITGTAGDGIAVVDLSWLSEPAPLGAENSNAHIDASLQHHSGDPDSSRQQGCPRRPPDSASCEQRCLGSQGSLGFAPLIFGRWRDSIIAELLTVHPRNYRCEKSRMRTFPRKTSWNESPRLGQAKRNILASRHPSKGR